MLNIYISIPQARRESLSWERASYSRMLLSYVQVVRCIDHCRSFDSRSPSQSPAKMTVCLSVHDSTAFAPVRQVAAKEVLRSSACRSPMSNLGYALLTWVESASGRVSLDYRCSVQVRMGCPSERLTSEQRYVRVRRTLIEHSFLLNMKLKECWGPTRS